MNISSKDIRKRDFKKALRGYDPGEVDAFLDTVSSHYDKIILENRTLNDKMKSLLSDIDIYKDNESNLQKALIKSQDLGEEILLNAKKKAELILKEAEINAKNLKQNFDYELINQRQELEDAKLKNERMLDELKSYLIDKINEIEDFKRNRKIYKMELTKLTNQNEEEMQPEEEAEEQQEKPKRKITITPESPYKNNKPFDDNFELK